MKSRILWMLLWLFAISKAYSQSWQRIQLEFPDTTAESMLDGTLFGDTAIIMGANGKTFYSTDFFQTYSIDSTYYQHEFNAMEFANHDTGYIETATFGGGLLVTTNGGISFRPYLNGAPTGFGFYNLLQLTHGDTAYAASTVQNDVERVGMYFHQDHPIAPVINNCNQVVQMRVTNDSTMYMLSSDEFPQINNGLLYLLRSTDYGNTWQLLSNTELRGNGDFRIIDDTTIIAIGSQTIVKSRDGGLSFDTVMHTNNPYDNVNQFMRGLFFVSHDTGFATWGSTLYRSYNAGDTWVQTDFVSNLNAYEGGILFITASSSQKIIVGCEYGQIYKTTNGGGLYTGLNNVTPLPTFTLSPNPTTGSLKITPPTNTGANYNIEVTNLLGQTVYKTYVTNNQINISNLAPGMYLLNLEVNGAYQTTKFVKQ